MTASPSDAFRHLPTLRHPVKPAEQSELRFTPQVLAMWDDRARAQGRPADWRWSDEQIEASRRATLDGLDLHQGLWVFGYGSLMWDPGVHFAEIRLATLGGQRRRFNFRTALARGTVEQPALMLSLEPGPGDCRGLAIHLAAELAEAELTLLWRREMIRGAYRPQMLPVATPQGDIAALVFTSNPRHPEYVGELPIDDTAAIIARACGVMGSNRAYLEQMAHQLQMLGIHDDYVVQLLRRVQALGPA